MQYKVTTDDSYEGVQVNTFDSLNQLLHEYPCFSSIFVLCQEDIKQATLLDDEDPVYIKVERIDDVLDNKDDESTTARDRCVAMINSAANYFEKHGTFPRARDEMTAAERIAPGLYSKSLSFPARNVFDPNAEKLRAAIISDDLTEAHE